MTEILSSYLPFRDTGFELGYQLPGYFLDVIDVVGFHAWGATGRCDNNKCAMA